MGANCEPDLTFRKSVRFGGGEIKTGLSARHSFPTSKYDLFSRDSDHFAPAQVI
jgi:hypothetical protein